MFTPLLIGPHNSLAIFQSLYYWLHRQKVNKGVDYEKQVQSLCQVSPPFFVPFKILYTPPCLIKSVGVSQIKGNLKKLLKLRVNAS